MRKDKIMDSERNSMEPFHPDPVGSVRDVKIARFACQGETGYGSFWKRFTGLAVGCFTLLIVLVAAIYQAVRTRRKQRQLGETGPGADVRMPPENRRP